MAIRIEKGMYKDIPSVIITTDRVIATFLPSQGGKLTSLKAVATGREYLAQRRGETYRKLGLDTNYVDAECAAYDDMFPTIDPWESPDGPLAGKPYLDHGEVSRTPAEFTLGETAVDTFMRSQFLPFTFEKRITENSRGGIRIDFTATNTGDVDMDCIWAAHFMAMAEEGGSVISPYRDGDRAEIVFATDAEKFGKRNDVITLPYGIDGKTRVDVSGKHEEGTANAWKYYYSEKAPHGYLGYFYPSDGSRVMFHFDPQEVPYAGVWMNDGNGAALGEYHNAALEICTGSFDRPDTARERGQYSVLPAGKALHWHLEIDIDL